MEFDIHLSHGFFNKTAKSVIILDKNKQIIMVNPSFQKLMGFKPDEMIGRNMDKLSDRKKDMFYQNMWQTVENEDIWEGEIWNKKKNGELFLEKRTITKMRNQSDNRGYVIMGEEITNYKIDGKKAEKANIKDYVTNLPSRNLFQKKFADTLKRSDADQRKPAVLMINVERFQQIDKTFGFTIGDDLLKMIAKRLNKFISKTDTLSRIAGGLFVLIMPDVENETDTAALLDRVLDSFAKKPFIISEQEVYISLSIGISFYPEDGSDEKELLRNADFARYRALENGDNSYEFYTPNLNVQMFERLILETNLRKAIERKELILYFQPQVDLKTNQMVAAEALIRWNHPELGLVPPSKFIPLAEETGLIIPIGNWVMREACKQNKKWQQLGYEPITIAVNLSLRQFQQTEIVHVINQALADSGLQAQYLELEITESMVMNNVEKVIEILNSLKKKGIKISIDDFGTGYSSLNYLAKLPLDALKIDRSFIQNAGANKEDSTIVSTIVAMAHNLNLEVVAEGVETQEHIDFLTQISCEKYQGYYFKPPIPSEQFESLLKKKSD